jgi:quercetin dioxygenase-like cupin family protein
VIKRVARGEAKRLGLPGRDWYTYLTPENSPARNLSIGLSVFPPGSRPEGHVHPAEEETIYVTAGRGRLVTPEATADLEPGVAVIIPSGTFHATESDGPGDLELVCFFTPPVIPGSYERREGG